MAMALASFYWHIAVKYLLDVFCVGAEERRDVCHTHFDVWWFDYSHDFSFNHLSFLSLVIFDDLAESRRKFTKCQRHKINKNKCYNYCVDINSRSHKPCTNILICAYPSQIKISRFRTHSAQPWGTNVVRGEKGG